MNAHVPARPELRIDLTDDGWIVETFTPYDPAEQLQKRMGAFFRSVSAHQRAAELSEEPWKDQGDAEQDYEAQMKEAALVLQAGHGTHSRRHFCFADHPALVLHLVEFTRRMTPGPVRERLEQLWDERAALVDQALQGQGGSAPPDPPVPEGGARGGAAP